MKTTEELCRLTTVSRGPRSTGPSSCCRMLEVFQSHSVPYLPPFERLLTSISSTIWEVVAAYPVLPPHPSVPLTKLQCSLPKSVNLYVPEIEFPPELLEDVRHNKKFELAKEGFQALLGIGEGYPLKTRSLAIAARKHDDVG
jgi:hypothetical protein